MSPMAYYLLLVGLIIFLCSWLKGFLNYSILQVKNKYAGTHEQYEKLLQENEKLKYENSLLGLKADETIALYDMAKELYRWLDENTIFASFKEHINRYIKILDCALLKPRADLRDYSEYLILPLKVNNSSLGYLVVKGLSESDKDKFHILTQQFSLGLKRVMLYKKVQDLAITDSLTQVFTRRYCLELLDEEIKRSAKFKHDFTMAMLDIDHFKRYNDHYGHLVGDVILREVSRVTKENIRQIDFIGRYGGEEFAIIFTETDKEQAKFAAERIRRAVADKKIRAYDEEIRLSVSIGIATYPLDAKDAQELIEKADTALYQAKQTGRNKVCIYQPSK